MEILETAFMQRALIAALLVGITAPAIGIYLVQRRQALMGDGIGHVAMTGVGLGFLLSANPIWMATIVSVAGAVTMELIRAYGRTRGTSRSRCSSTGAWRAVSCSSTSPTAGPRRT